jgi:hypothetical protein
VRLALESRETVLALFALADATAQDVRHKLLAVADAEDGAIGGENLRIDLRAARLVNAVRAARDDDALAAGQLGRGSFAGLNVGVDAQIADLPSDQVTILPARVEDGDLWLAQISSVTDLFGSARRSAFSTYPARLSRQAWSR